MADYTMVKRKKAASFPKANPGIDYESPIGPVRPVPLTRAQMIEERGKQLTAKVSGVLSHPVVQGAWNRISHAQGNIDKQSKKSRKSSGGGGGGFGSPGGMNFSVPDVGGFSPMQGNPWDTNPYGGAPAAPRKHHRKKPAQNVVHHHHYHRY